LSYAFEGSSPHFSQVALHRKHQQEAAAAGSDAAAPGLATDSTRPGGSAASSSSSSTQQQSAASASRLINPLQLLFGKSWRKAVLLSVLFFTSTFIFTMLQVG
jgi:hypothetical protein